MKVRKVNYKNGEALIIYITPVENENSIIKKKILEYKKAYLNVAVFISGNNGIEEVLRTAIQNYM